MSKIHGVLCRVGVVMSTVLIAASILVGQQSPGPSGPGTPTGTCDEIRTGGGPIQYCQDNGCTSSGKDCLTIRDGGSGTPITRCVCQPKT